ncbi:hypothetical protein [Streptomyces syringium]|uniref:hypothetical protein n=1 Tax=Streptomyces syringium TaxID=76729 RepID=UPI0034519D5A
MGPFSCEPSSVTLTRSVRRVRKSRANTSYKRLVLLVTRWDAKDEKRPYLPSALSPSGSDQSVGLRAAETDAHLDGAAPRRVRLRR